MRRVRPFLPALGLVAAFSSAAAAMPHQAANHTLTPQIYRQRCLFCHKSAAPEGVAPEILVGLHPPPGVKPADVMPDIKCWRRCEKCWPEKSATRR